MHELGWTAAKLAEECNVSPTSINRFYKRRAGIDVVSKVAKALSLPDPGEALASDDGKDWLDLGVHLRALAPREYDSILKFARTVVELERQRQAMRSLIEARMEDAVTSLRAIVADDTDGGSRG